MPNLPNLLFAVKQESNVCRDRDYNIMTEDGKNIYCDETITDYIAQGIPILSRDEFEEPVKIMDDVVVISAASGVSAAIKTDGSLWLWGTGGSNPSRLGGLYDADRYHLEEYQNALASPQMLIDSGVEDIAFGEYNALVLMKDGTLLSWGDVKGPLGFKPDVKGQLLQPTAVPGIETLPQDSTTLLSSENPEAGSGWKQDLMGMYLFLQKSWMDVTYIFGLSTSEGM